MPSYLGSVSQIPSSSIADYGPFSGVASTYAAGASPLLWSSTTPPTVPLSATIPGVSAGCFGASLPPQSASVPMVALSLPVYHSPWLALGFHLPPIHPSTLSINIKNFVTIVLTTVEIFLPWRIQFITFLIIQQLNGFFNGTIDTTTSFILDYNGVQHPNPSHWVWLCLDQLIRSWLFALGSTEVRDLIHSKQIWECLSRRFNTASLTRAMDLRCTLSTLSKDPKQSMEEYLRGIKHIAISLASLRTLVPDIDLVQLILNGLDEEYHNLVTTLSCDTNVLTFDDLRSKLIHYEQHLQFLNTKKLSRVHHPVLATTVFPRLILGIFLRLPPFIVAIAPVVINTRGATTNGKFISSKGAAIVIPINININLPAGVCLRELDLVIIHLKGS